ncbi:NAD(P)H-dependent oxidoreductase [Lentibacillus salicampi]|uniref:NADPH-dependent FMN reductase-like domain-containing protein n=1 Tax=Lentibacillus salicampi TaxID=175306 RepID=A0A4Y9AGN7_9BACI|nr:NAD(P)H-dependent oxidoreductase [Lentibacillus salicampi]TFJ94140.1 hypothetical protein E4U82_02440 [Lentibacillus salicampi]
MRIAGISGSIRDDSYNNMLLKNIKNRYSSHFDLELIKVDKLPLLDIVERAVKNFSGMLSAGQGV